MDHMRKFGENMTIDAGNVKATNGDIYGMKRTIDSNNLKDLKCDETTDKKGFMLIDSYIETRISILLGKERAQERQRQLEKER